MKTIKIPIGVNASLDGGPFFDFSADGIDGETDVEAGVLVGEDQNGNRCEYTIDEIQDIVRSEMENSEPIKVNTGDVRDTDGEPSTVGCIRVPLWYGYTLEVWDLKTPDRQIGDLTGYSQRTLYEKRLQRHGGMIDG